MPESPFDDIEFDKEQMMSQRSAAKQESWENSVIKTILKYKPDKAKEAQQIAVDNYSVTGKFVYTFDGFLSMFPEFPVYLFCTKIPYVSQITHAQLWNKSGNNIITNAYRRHEDKLPDFWDCKPYGVVFEWLHGGGTPKIIHDHHLKDNLGTHIVIPQNREDRPYCIIENLKDFIEHTWK